jgi:hypothetical protein
VAKEGMSVAFLVSLGTSRVVLNGISYAGIGLSFSDAKSLSEFVSQQQNYNLSQQQTVSVLRSTLSPDSVKAYIACVDSSRGVSIELPDAALSEDNFQFTVSWNPNYKAKKSTLKIVTTNGEIIGDSKVQISPTDSTTFTLKRTLPDKALFISASVDGKTDIVSIPRLPAFALKLRELFDPPKEQPQDTLIRDGGHGTVYVDRIHCISATSGDTSLIPSTMIFEGQIYGDTNRAKVTIDTKTNSSRRSCGHMINSTGCNQCSNGITGRFAIFEAYLAPTADKSKGAIDILLRGAGANLKFFALIFAIGADRRADFVTRRVGQAPSRFAYLYPFSIRKDVHCPPQIRGRRVYTSGAVRRNPAQPKPLQSRRLIVPAIANAGNPGATCTCTSTARASIPSNATVETR